jgi:hypothetical protein
VLFYVRSDRVVQNKGLSKAFGKSMKVYFEHETDCCINWLRVPWLAMNYGSLLPSSAVASACPVFGPVAYYGLMPAHVGTPQWTTYTGVQVKPAFRTSAGCVLPALLGPAFRHLILVTMIFEANWRKSYGMCWKQTVQKNLITFISVLWAVSWGPVEHWVRASTCLWFI